MIYSHAVSTYIVYVVRVPSSAIGFIFKLNDQERMPSWLWSQFRLGNVGVCSFAVIVEPTGGADVEFPFPLHRHDGRGLTIQLSKCAAPPTGTGCSASANRGEGRGADARKPTRYRHITRPSTAREGFLDLTISPSSPDQNCCSSGEAGWPCAGAAFDTYKDKVPS